MERMTSLISDHLGYVDEALGDVRRQREAASAESRTVSAELERQRRERQVMESELNKLGEQRRQVEVAEAETDLRLTTIVDQVRTELGVDPDTAMAAPLPELAEGVSPKARLREVQTELERMGPINPLALEEFEALQERHEFLQAQMDDVKSSRSELRKVIKAIDEEIVRVFSSAYADVSENFTVLFETLFPGGRGALKLTDPSDLLTTGVEVEAKPSGKNVRKLSLLSGGERSLTALAYLFAVFRSRPSPFYVMDEVEAALDDVNLHRFLGLVEEFRNDAQLLIVSHQKRTMEAADCLYGVSMKPGGSSKVVSEKTSSERAPVA